MAEKDYCFLNSPLQASISSRNIYFWILVMVMQLRKNTIKQFMDTIYATKLSWQTFCLQNKGVGCIKTIITGHQGQYY